MAYYVLIVQVYRLKILATSMINFTHWTLGQFCTQHVINNGSPERVSLYVAEALLS